jgi:hypothetical protein
VKEESSPTHQAINLKAQKLAYRTIRTIMVEIGAIENAKTKGGRDERDSYSLEQ